MDDEALRVLREASRIRQRKEPLERAIGRAVRSLGKDYSYYIALVSELRETASMDRVSVEEELKMLVDRHEDDG